MRDRGIHEHGLAPELSDAHSVPYDAGFGMSNDRGTPGCPTMSNDAAVSVDMPTASSERAHRIRSQRNPHMIGLGVATIALGGLGAAWVFSSMTGSVSIVAVASTVDRGEVISEADLTTASISLDPVLKPVAATRINDLVGLRAAFDLPSGTILTMDSTTANPLPGPGQTIVGVSVPTTRIPAEGLRAGDQIRVVDTPREGEDPPVAVPPSQAAAVVGVAVDPESGYTIVDVVLESGNAARLAARSATGRVVVVQDSAVSG
jgi:hypothetical protein